MESKQQLGQTLSVDPMELKQTLFDDQTSASSSSAADAAVVDDDSSYPSDCESGISGPENHGRQNLLPAATNGLIRVGQGERIHQAIERSFVSSLSSCGLNARVESVHRNDLSIAMRRAKFQSFCLYSKATEEACGGSANLKYAWYGASKEEIDAILSHGFGLPLNGGAYGQGLHLSPADHPMESVQSAVGDENGLKHLLLCRVIMGRMEPLLPDSRQCNPTSEEFDSGVDNLAQPKKYVVWASKMNTHVWPEFVVSFRASSPNCKDFQRVPAQFLPRSDWMPFPNLIKVLSRFLPADAVELISKHHSDFKKRKISRNGMIGLVRNIAGDNLLSAIIKAYRVKIGACPKNSNFKAARKNCAEKS